MKVWEPDDEGKVKSFEEKYKTWHTYYSFTKSGFRMIGCVAAAYLYVRGPSPDIAFMVLCGSLLVAEIIGIIEEF